MTLAVDRAAEDAALEALGAAGRPLTVISEERGQVELNGGGGEVVVLDPVDGSLNAKRGLPFHAVSIAVAAGRTMDTVGVRLRRRPGLRAALVGGTRSRRLCERGAPGAARGRAARGSRAGDGAPGAGRGRRRDAGRARGAAPAYARLGGALPLPGGRRQVRRDAHPARGAQRGRRRRAADRARGGRQPSSSRRQARAPGWAWRCARACWRLEARRLRTASAGHRGSPWRGLKRVDCAGPGITRRRRGKGFEYFDEDGRKITEPTVIQRISELAIPPAWDQVWVCPYPLGPHPGHRPRRGRAKAVPLPRPLARAPRSREVRGDAGLRSRPAGAAQAGGA